MSHKEKEGFQFRQFFVGQQHCAMKVGTDGVLLGAWAEGGTHILDIGTGTGVVALMMAQRFPSANIDAIEIDREAAGQAADNVRCSPFADRVTVTHAALQDFRPSKSYDSIVCNPPYFLNSYYERRHENFPHVCWSPSAAHFTVLLSTPSSV